MSTEPINILLVDDQPAKLLSYEAILSDLNENLLKASSARQALEFLLKRDIAVVLVDVCMPDLDGFELAAMIRNHPRFQATSIIFISAVALTDIDRLKGYEYGGVDYVPVPVVPEVLRAKVRVFADLYRKTRALEQLNTDLEQRVAERTAALERANAELERRVEERTRERQTALEQVHQMQKLESLGQLTGGLAHDFNNLLMAILANLDLLGKHLPNDRSVRRYVDSAVQAAEHGATLTQRMLSFARRQALRPEAVDVAGLVADMTEMLKRSLGPAIEIATDFVADLGLSRVDPNQLELALLNLALNARDAMPGGGKLIFSGRRERVPAGRVPGLGSGDYVCVAVTDTGSGMDEKMLERAAEPFFTTKEVGKGTGLGLSMVFGFATQSGGAAQIHSTPGQGTAVEIWLPIAEAAPAGEAPAREPAAAVATPARSVLMVDDNPLVAQSMAAMLQFLGHEVLVASSGAEALDIVGSSARIDLVVTDQAMPNMTGVELIRRIRELRADLPTILTTGYSELPGPLDPGIARLDKPYHLDRLAAVIASVLGDGQAFPEPAAADPPARRRRAAAAHGGARQRSERIGAP